MADRIPHPDMDKVVWIPDFPKIGKACIEKLLDKFPEYGNSWIINNSPSFWEKRITKELDEVLKAKTPEEMQKEIIDCINVLGMMYEGAFDIMELKLSVEQQKVLKE